MRKKILPVLALLAAVMLGAPMLAAAATFLTDNNSEVSQAVDDDIYAAGRMVSIRGDVNGDVFAAGNTVEVTKNVTGDVFAAGEAVMVRGAVEDDILAAGNTVLIEGSQADDVFAAGSAVTIGEAVNASGDAYLAGETIVIRGKVNGTVRLAGGNVRLGPDAEIGGDLITYGDREPRITQDDGAVIRGEQRHVVAQMPQKPDFSGAWKAGAGLWVTDWVRRIVTWTILTWLLILAAPGLAAAVVSRFKEKTWAVLGVGVLWVIAFVPVAVLLAITVIGLPVSFLLGLVTLALFILAIGYAHLITGRYLAKYIFPNKPEAMGWREALVGAIALATVRIIPVLGGLAVSVVTVMALGTVVMAWGRALRQHKS